MPLWIVWIIVAVLMIAVEVVSQWMWTLCLAIGSLVALVLSLFAVSLPVQIAVAAVVAVVAYFALVPFARRWYASAWKGHQKSDRTGMEALLGRRAVVTREIRPGHLGYARIDGDYWQVRAHGVDSVVPVGSFMTVTAYDSIILTVEPTL